MSVVIRLARTGKRGERKFRIVVKEKRSRRDGPAIETLGYLEKGPNGKRKIDKERYQYSLTKGAKSSIAVAKLLE